MNLALSLASAVLLILIFPGFNFTWLAPFAIAPLLVACAREASWKRRFLNGWAAGFVFWFGVCYWIQFVLEVHGGLGRWWRMGLVFLFAVLKGLHLGLFAALAGRLMQKRFAIPAVAALWTGIERTHGHAGLRLARFGERGNRHARADAPGARHRRLRLVVRFCDAGLRRRSARSSSPATGNAVAAPASARRDTGSSSAAAAAPWSRTGARGSAQYRHRGGMDHRIAGRPGA